MAEQGTDTERLSPEQQAAYRFDPALRTGGAVLEAGGSAVDAVVATISVMEDDSLFNAGRGAVYGLGSARSWTQAS